MKTTKQLMKELGDKNTLHLVWALFWRYAVIYLGLAFLAGVVIGILG